ncbi:TRAP transporter large permease [Colidextribacter sp. OB.20]|uniref:TRAP transporter large permease n=1 Tax=Colidextribacter sp. OB.20 TaxID=2304568 RepID=UPI0013709828|nr:TRAP transporter large permease [Colidextribacter sp. OB.20]NBI09528.1 TRAP transporter large permease [Colidextribacter sp. OB.20]
MNWGVFVLFAVLAVCFIIRMPISFSMLVAPIAYFLVANPNRLNSLYTVITGNMIAGFTMLAAPLFVFMANVLNESEITDKMFNFCNGLLGRMKGGTAQVNVLISLIFSGMTGSAIADASGIGLMEIQQMKKEGYDAEFSCAITAASATIGPIFPPSIPMVIYGMLSGASVGKLFMGGMVPGVLLAILLMIYVFFISHKRNYPSGVIMTLAQFLRATLIALPALLTVILLLWGIYGGVCTPTEAGALASAYALLIGFLVYRSLGWEKLKIILVKTAANTATLALLCGSAYLFSYVVALEKIPATVASFVTGICPNKYIFLLVVNIVFLLLGCVLDVSTIQLVFVPMVLPLVKAFGIDLVHFGVVICLNMMIGLSTPPFGMLLFIVSGLGKTKIAGVIREILPMVIIMIALLFLCTYCEPIVMFLPNLMHGA